VPELPEVETVRADLAEHVAGRRIARADVYHPRAVRRHPAGGDDFAAALAGRTILGARRRGKYLWLPLDGVASRPAADPAEGDAILCHLGMSGQMLVRDAGAGAGDPHLRVRIVFDDDGPDLHFVDQRTFGGMCLSPGGAQLPPEIAHIARDPMDPEFDDAGFVAALRRRRTGVKRALLDQTLVSGVGNIYADEALWRARLHGERPADRLRRSDAVALLGHVRDVLAAALSARGTSFDRLYVDVNGDSGRYSTALRAYGQQGRPCARCGTPIVREAFMNRSSFSCPTCQPRPRLGRVAAGRPVVRVSGSR
jgi:formamidopyrimidine-DNA glycosylase